MISLDSCKRGYYNLKKGAILLVTGRKQLASGKEQHTRCEATQIRSYSEPRIYTILRRIYPKAGLKAKLNSTTIATFVLHIPPIKAIQSISKSEPLQTSKNFEGGLVDI